MSTRKQPYLINGVDVHSDEFMRWMVRENYRAIDDGRRLLNARELTAKYAAEHQLPRARPQRAPTVLRLIAMDGKRVDGKGALT